MNRGSDKDSRCSTSVYIYIVFMAGGPVAWMSRLQLIVTVSSMVSEYIGCFYLIQELIWIRQFLKDIQLQRCKATKVYWIHDQVSSEEVELIHIYTDEQTADVLTKHVEGSVFYKHVDRIMEDMAP